MAAIFTGLILRPFAGGTVGFLAASALALMGIAVSNVLMPVIVKRYFPDRIGSMTGLYSMALALGTSIAAAATVPMTAALGGDWRIGLGVWAAIAALAVLPWIPLVRDRDRATRAARTTAAAAAETAAPRITRSRTAWSLGCYFGLQATGAYITMGWMPQIFRDSRRPRLHRGRTPRRHHGHGRPARLRDPPARHPDEEPGPDRRRPRPLRPHAATPASSSPPPRAPGPGPCSSASPTAPSRSPSR